MAVETATNINQLDPLLPAASDGKSEGDNHIRLVKATLKTTFNGITGISISPVSNSDEVLATTSQVASAISLAKASIADGAELASNKDATGGYAGLTLFKLNLKNAANTFTNFLANATTAARTWTMPDKDGTVAMTSDVPFPLAGFRNRIINGGFAVNQRAVSGTVVLAAGIYGHDRWKAGASGCTYTFSTASNVTTLTISAGSLQQVIEGRNLQSGTHTLSWAGTAQGNIAGGSYSASGVTGSAIGGANLTIEFNTGTVSVVQLEVGSTATAFEQRPYGVELALCQRYLPPVSNSPGVIYSATNAYVSSTYPVTPRVAPTGVTVTALGVLLVGGVGIAVTSTAFTAASTAGAILQLAFASGGIANAGTVHYAMTGYFTGCEL